MKNVNNTMNDKKNRINEIKVIIAEHGELHIEDFDMDILFNKVFGTELSKYNYKMVKIMGSIKLSNGNKIVEILDEGCIIKQEGVGEDDYDLIVMAYEDLSEDIIVRILTYLHLALIY